MKKLLIGLGLVTMLVGCASRENGNGMGGTGDSMKTDSYNTGSSSSDQQQLNNNVNDTTGTPVAPSPNNGVGTP